MSHVRQLSGSLVKLSTIDIYTSTEPSLRAKLKWVLRYVIYATILWIIIAGSIVIRNAHKTKLFQKPEYISSCCKCWTKANEDSYNGPQLEFAHCLDNKCNCNICYDKYDQYLDDIFNSTHINDSYYEDVNCSYLDKHYTFQYETTKYPSKPTADKGCYKHLSTTSFNLPIPKAYNFYGYFAIAICAYHILLLWLYLVIYKSINIGILFFVHSIVNAEICFYCLLKSYQFQLDHETNCFESIIKTETDTIIWQFVPYSIIFHVALQYAFSCSRSCFNKCKTGKKIYPLFGKLVVIVTFLCLLWSLGVYIWVCYLLRHSFTEDNRMGIIVVVTCIFLATIGLFPFPFCREVTFQVLESWDCLFYRFGCFGCCCSRARHLSQMQTYADRYGWQEALLDGNSDVEEDGYSNHQSHYNL